MLPPSADGRTFKFLIFMSLFFRTKVVPDVGCLGENFFVDGYESRPDGAKIEISSIPVFSHSRVAAQVFAKSGISNAKKREHKRALGQKFPSKFQKEEVSVPHSSESLSFSKNCFTVLK